AAVVGNEDFRQAGVLEDADALEAHVRQDESLAFAHGPAESPALPADGGAGLRAGRVLLAGRRQRRRPRSFKPSGVGREGGQDQQGAENQTTAANGHRQLLDPWLRAGTVSENQGVDTPRSPGWAVIPANRSGPLPPRPGAAPAGTAWSGRRRRRVVRCGVGI